ASEDERERNPMQIEDDLYIQRMLSQSLNCALKACDRVAENGGDDIAVARMTAERLLRYAEDRHRSRTPDEPLQICRGSEENSSKIEENQNTQAAALDYVTCDDVSVFPVKADKSPYTPNGFKDATRDTATVGEMWRRTPEAGIGVPTGEASGWLVLDIDPRHGGDVSLTSLIEEHGDGWLETMQARTGGGGHHIIFAFPQGSNIRNSAGRLGEGIDVRGEGGYIIVAPSLHASGRRYEWLNDLKPTEPPEWLIKRLTTSQAISTQKTQPRAQSSASIGGLIPEGERNETLFKIGCALRGQGWNYAEIEAELMTVNARRCSSPLPVEEVQKIARSAASYAPNRVAVGA
ncbi:MAG TPA: bifunctional DNA primase/polymerase, partial [Pyrinomonadaceae bacterium]|nr:bifunctional DNA primase/polymerase [Pyrinomonadaceae bacterium]